MIVYALEKEGRRVSFDTQVEGAMHLRDIKFKNEYNIISIPEMSVQNRRKHSHRRSSSLLEEPESSTQPERATFTSDITSQETMKLLQQS